MLIIYIIISRMHVLTELEGGVVLPINYEYPKTRSTASTWARNSRTGVY